MHNIIMIIKQSIFSRQSIISIASGGYVLICGEVHVVEIWHRKQWMPTLNHSIYKQWAFVCPTTSILPEMRWMNQVMDNQNIR